MKTYHIATIGYGGMGRWHHEGILKTDRLVFTGVYDIDPKRRELALADGFTRAYATADELFADSDIDVVLCATPNNFHKPYVCRALEAGKAVICEKPVAMSSEELQVMIDTAKRAGGIFTVHQNRRADPDFLRVREEIASGRLGQVFELESRVNGSRGIPEGWRQYAVAGGGMMLDWGVHLIDQLVTMESTPVTSVYCRMYHVHYKECDDGFRLVMEFASGLRAIVEVGTSHYAPTPRWVVYGDRGGMRILDWNGNGDIVRATERDVHFEEEIIYTKAGPTKTMSPRAKETIEEIKLDPADMPAGDYDGFYRNLAEVLDGTAELLVKPEETMRVMRIMEAAFASDRENKVICGPF